MQDRSEGFLLYDPIKQGIQKISKICLGRRPMRVTLPLFWTEALQKCSLFHALSTDQVSMSYFFPSQGIKRSVIKFLFRQRMAS